MTEKQTTKKQGTGTREQGKESLADNRQPTTDNCRHDWHYSFVTHRHECTKCGIPAPRNWNEVGF